MRLVDSNIIPVTKSEQDKRDKMKAINKLIEPLQEAIKHWSNTEQGKTCTVLLKRKNNMEMQMKNNEPMGDYLTPAEMTEYQALDAARE